MAEVAEVAERGSPMGEQEIDVIAAEEEGVGVWRSEGSELRNKKYNRARQRAYRRLAIERPERFKEIMLEEKEAEGL